MKFNIFFLKDGKLEKIYEIRRNATGLYLHTSGNRPHFTYHEDGKSWFKHPSLFTKFPDLITKKQRVPLAEFVEPETITTFNILDFNSSGQKNWKLNAEDIVIDLTPPFCVELILCREEIALAASKERVNSKIYTIRDMSPMMIIEAYEIVNRTLVLPRFTIKHDDLE